MKKRVIFSIGMVIFLLLIFWWGKQCYKKPPKKVIPILEEVEGKNLPVFSDDLNGKNLKNAIRAQIDRLRHTDLDQKVKFGDMIIPRKKILKTLEEFLRLLEGKGVSSLNSEIPRRFLIFQSAGVNQKKEVIFTGYYQPVLEASTRPDKKFKYPIYRLPSDLQVIDLGEINPKLKGEKIALRIEGNRIKPYFNRKAIDQDLVLRGKGLELLFLKDFLDCYLLHVQGSGVMKVENGDEIKVRYAGSNCFPYVSLRELLVDQGLLRPHQASFSEIRSYFQKNPEKIKEYLLQNPRYIFFEKYTGEIIGSEGVELTPGRSIATDKSIFPGGGLALIICRRPVLDSQGQIIRWQPMVRFMVDQDTGAAIKGPGRVDIFWGTGKRAGEVAGYMKEKGKLYYLLIKND
ncbi:MAG: MltA domain-containing protein [Desulfobacterota bacterium]|nr:MltA domain-containing protein [Thermodesulfobacteriota bacterium]